MDGVYLFCWHADDEEVSGRSIHGDGGALQDEEVHNGFPIFVEWLGRSQASSSLKYIVSESIYRVKEKLNRHLSEGAVTGHDRVWVVSVMTAQKEGLWVPLCWGGSWTGRDLNTKSSALCVIVKENQICTTINYSKLNSAILKFFNSSPRTGWTAHSQSSVCERVFFPLLEV